MLPTKRITTHPGVVLQEEFLTPMGITQSALARHIGVHHFVVCNLCHGKRGITPRLAVMLARALEEPLRSEDASGPQHSLAEQVQDALHTLELRHIQRRLREVRSQIAEAERRADNAMLERLIAEKMALDRKLRES